MHLHCRMHFDLPTFPQYRTLSTPHQYSSSTHSPSLSFTSTSFTTLFSFLLSCLSLLPQIFHRFLPTFSNFLLSFLLLFIPMLSRPDDIWHCSLFWRILHDSSPLVHDWCSKLLMEVDGRFLHRKYYDKPFICQRCGDQRARSENISFILLRFFFCVAFLFSSQHLAAWSMIALYVMHRFATLFDEWGRGNSCLGYGLLNEWSYKRPTIISPSKDIIKILEWLHSHDIYIHRTRYLTCYSGKNSLPTFNPANGVQSYSSNILWPCRMGQMESRGLWNRKWNER